jgi:hypothetical protein
MKKYLLAYGIAMALLAPFPALAQNVTVDWDRNVHNFSSFKTYAWKKPVRSTTNPLMDERIVTAINNQMTAKGLQQIESNPDVFVTYGAGVRPEKSAIVMGTGRFRMGGGMGTINQNISNEGTLVVDISDAGTGKLLWRGAAADTISEKPDKNAKKIEKAVEKMFKKYPPANK